MKSIYLTVMMLCATTTLHASERAGSEIADSPDLTGDAGILFWTPEQQVTGYSSIADLYPTRQIQGRSSPSVLPEKLTSLDRFTYQLGGQALTIADYMQNQRTAGLLVIHNGVLKVEALRLGTSTAKAMGFFFGHKICCQHAVRAAIRMASSNL